MTFLTDDQIERRVERTMNALDNCLMSGAFTQEEYDREVVKLDQWAQQCYDARKRVS